MSGDPIKIGPFVGGLNTFSDNSAVSDNELVECLNFEPDLDGSIKSRPPAAKLSSYMPLGATGNPTILGTFYATGSAPFVLGSNGGNSTYYYDGSSWILVTATFAATAMIQFDNKAWLLAPVGSANPGGYWTPDGGFVDQPNLPKGEIIVANKLRLWVARGKDATENGTRLYFSKVLGQPDFWPIAPDFIDIGGGDGQNIVQATVYYQSILLFRTDSIYSFNYTTDPANGIVSAVTIGVGLTSKECLVSYENYLYFQYHGRAYEFINARAQQINIKVPFYENTRTNIYEPYSVSIFNERILFQWWDTTYVFYLKTRTWTRWRTTELGAFGKWLQRPLTGEFPESIGFSSLSVPSGSSRKAYTMTIQDGFTTRTENFQCTMQTKNYNYEASSVWKRLFWWAIDASFSGRVVGTVAAINFTTSSTWAQVRNTTWGQLLLQTWGKLSSDTYSVTTERDTSGTGPQRKTVKMPKSLKFKQVYYLLVFDTDGSSRTAPVRMHSLMTYVRAKQTVSTTVS